MEIKFDWDSDAIEREVRKKLEARVANVRCPVHGTGATFDSSKGTLVSPCCDELTKAVKRALA
jgi:hypothetical protein